MNFFTRLRHAYQLYTFAFADKRMPVMSKILSILAVIYLVSPLDILPDILPVIGQLDDIVVILMAVLQFLRSIPKDVRRDEAKRERIKVDATY